MCVGMKAKSTYIYSQDSVVQVYQPLSYFLNFSSKFLKKDWGLEHSARLSFCFSWETSSVFCSSATTEEPPILEYFFPLLDEGSIEKIVFLFLFVNFNHRFQWGINIFRS
jgi:hypothetical protein